jgi:hypothetical protein
VRLEGTVPAQVIGQCMARATSFVKAGVNKHVAWSDKMAVGQLETQDDDARWAVEAAGGGLEARHRHERAVMRAAHPAFDNVRHREGLEHLPNGRELPLAAHDAHRIVLAHVL